MLIPTILRKARSAGIHLRRFTISQRFGFSPTSVYDDAFYDGPGCHAGLIHADAVASLLYERFGPRSVLDVGCGQGALLDAFAKRGVQGVGCEGSTHGVARCPRAALVFQADLKRPLLFNRGFDMVTCFEVAEHLPRRCARTLVKSIASAADKMVVFSASGPGQLGDDHINLQPLEYWVGLFSAERFHHRDADSKAVRDRLAELGAPAWFQNTIVLEKM